MNRSLAAAVLAAVLPASIVAQTQTASPAKRFGPALLVESAIHADGGDAILEAGERVRIRTVVTNAGARGASQVRLALRPAAPCAGIAMPDSLDLGDLPPGASREAIAEFALGDSIPDQQCTVLLQASDASGAVHPVDSLWFATEASILPQLHLAWHLEHQDAGIVEAAAPGDTVTIVLHLTNRGGRARDVSLHMDESTGSRPLDWADTLLAAGEIPAGDSVAHRILVAVASDPRTDTARIGVTVLEARASQTRRWEVVFPLAGSAELSLRRGTAAFQAGEVEAALGLYADAIRQDPGLAQAHFLQGLVYEYLGDKKRCVPSIRRAAELGDSTAIAWLEANETTRAPSVKYVALKPDPFAEAASGAGLAVLPFENEGPSDIAERVYRKLATNAGVRDRFTLYSSATLEDQQEALGLASLDPESESVRRALRAVDIRYVVYGTVSKESPLAISFRCVRTEDGTTLLDEKLRESRNSTALDDAVRLIAEAKRPVYRER